MSPSLETETTIENLVKAAKRGGYTEAISNVVDIVIASSSTINTKDELLIWLIAQLDTLNQKGPTHA